jgi:hypothetical protein
MIAFGLRLALRGGRESAIRLAIMAAAVALGVGLLLATLAGINGVGTQNARYAWLNTGSGSSTVDTRGSGGTDSLWWRVRADDYRDRLLGRIDVAATGPGSPVPPGIPRVPGPGEYYASPALRDLLASTPAAELGDRFPGHLAGTIGAAGLPAPDVLIVVIGHTPQELSRLPGAIQVTRIETTTPEQCNGVNCGVRAGINHNGMVLTLSVIALALVFPLLVFIGTATRLSAARREQRFAAMRLVGATPRQVAVVAAVESAVAAVLGMAAGFGLFFALRDPIAAIPFTGARFFPSDLALSLPDVLLIAIGVPVAAAIAARLALRRVFVSPLGVSRRVTPKPPRAWRIIPLLLGLLELRAVPALYAHPQTGMGQAVEYMPGFLLILIGLMTAGPWLTMAGARLISLRTSRPATLVATRRLADNPRAAFRAVSGLVLALFVMTVAVATIGGINANQGGQPGVQGAAARATVVDQLADPFRDEDGVPPVPSAVLDQLRAVPGVTGMVVVHHGPVPASLPMQPGLELDRDGQEVVAGLASCDQLASTPVLGKCPAGASVVAVPPDGAGHGFLRPQSTVVWPAVESPDLASLPVQTLVVGTDGSAGAIERVRTILEAAYPDQESPPEIAAGEDKLSTVAKYNQLAEVVILASLPIAGCTLAVSVVAGLADRRRPFALLRLTGAPFRVLRRVVALESVIPLLSVAVVSIAAALFASDLFVRSNMRLSMPLPGLSYYLSVVVGLAASLGIIAATFPLLRRTTGPETARNE